MNITVSSELISVNNSINLSPINSPATWMPDYTGAGLSDGAQVFLSRLWRLIRQGQRNPTIRRLANMLRKSTRTIRRYLVELVRAGLLIVHRHRVAFNRNNPNTYSLPGRGGVGDKNVIGELTKTLKTTTPAPAPASTISETRLRYEVSRAVNAATREAGRKWYESRGEMWQKLKESRLSKAIERTRAAMVGVYQAPAGEAVVYSEENSRQDALIYWRKMKEIGNAIYRDCPSWAKRIIEGA